jgi:hypothetical protein
LRNPIRRRALTAALRTTIALAAVAVVAVTSACSAGLGGPASSRAARDGVIRFTFAPDPIWDYMNETGIVDQWQRDTGYAIETSATWDEFGLFAGGHADIISTASFEVPGLEEQTQRETVIIGRYNAERSRILVPGRWPICGVSDSVSSPPSRGHWCGAAWSIRCTTWT